MNSRLAGYACATGVLLMLTVAGARSAAVGENAPLTMAQTKQSEPATPFTALASSPPSNPPGH